MAKRTTYSGPTTSSAVHTLSVLTGNVTEFRDGVQRVACSCGWTGKQRRSRKGAMAEAQKHIADLTAGAGQ